MKAVVVTDYGTPDVMQYIEVDPPALKPNQVLIRTVATTSHSLSSERLVR